ncbi:MAG: hypothetical protein GY795_49690 [Desulfobacterales bacterium]|nr:hypothetical protein [Desulfobacterales bacterium]
MKIHRWFTITILVFALQFSAHAAVFHVDLNSSAESPDGASWETAYKNIQDGIDAAYSDSGGEVWVADGTYDIAVTISMKTGVSIYGGFSGDETERNQRNWLIYPSIINANGSTRVMEANNADNVVIDGFTLTGGDATDVTRSRQKRSTSSDEILVSEGQYSGGGILIWQCAPTISNCNFAANIAIKGGAVYILVATSDSLEAEPEDAPVFTDCTFTENYSIWSGGAVSCDLLTNPTFNGCTFMYNTSVVIGGAVYLDWKCSPTLTNCLFAKNTSERAGAMGCDNSSSPTLVNCTIANNTAYDIGAGFYTGGYDSDSNTPRLINSTVWGNSNAWGGPEDFTPWHKSHYNITYSYIGRGFKSYGTGTITDDVSDPDLTTLFYDPSEDDYRHATESPCLDAGTSSGDNIPSDDINDYTRDDNPDMGAHEYVETGSLTVVISPAAAVAAGALWSVDGGTKWYESGTAQVLEVGSYTVTYSSVDGYGAPEDASVTIIKDDSESITATYTVYVGYLNVVLTPADIEAQWSADGGNTWYDSGTQSFSPGTYTVIFSSVDGYDTPADESVTLTADDTETVTVRYASQSGYLSVSISPSDTGAQWSADGGTTWYDSGTQAFDPGTYTVTFSSVDGYDTPADESVTLTADDTETVTVRYASQSGYLSVSISPSDTGAQWSADGGTTWYDSGTQSFDPGSYTVIFSDVDGYDTPEDESVTLTADTTESISVLYSETDQTTGVTESTSESDDSYTVYTTEEGDTYAVDQDGDYEYEWNTDSGLRRYPRQDSDSVKALPVAYLLENGNLLRTSPSGNTTFIADGAGGIVQEFRLDSSIAWQYSLSDSQYCLHHDVKYMPNGNILMLAWEYKSSTDAIAAGRDPMLMPAHGIWSDMIIEVAPDRENGGGTIVWEWHAWDHLIQDKNRFKANYGSVSAHPELIDINYTDTPVPASDWTRFNSIDYREDFDQILISANGFNEVWMIDHSATTQEAAGHTGGKSGKGGDLLYRWGNPAAYGATGTQQLYKQNDASWIAPDCPGAYNILVFNNGETYSSVMEIVPPADSSGNYQLNGSSYGPASPAWIYTASNPTDFFAPFGSGAQRLPNGNTLICDGPMGIFFEVTPEKKTAWKFVNPVTKNGMLGSKDPIPENADGERLNQVFSIQRYAKDYPGLPHSLRLDIGGVIRIIQIFSGIPLQGGYYDAVKDGKAGTDDVIYMMQNIAGIR